MQVNKGCYVDGNYLGNKIVTRNYTIYYIGNK